MLRQIERIQESTPVGEYPLLQSALDEAARLREEGDVQAARSIAQAVLSLYDSADPAAREGIAQAQQLLDETNDSAISAE